MGISTKNRRRIAVDGRQYLWWVTVDDTYYLSPGGHTVTVATEDRHFFVRYGLRQHEESRHIVFTGTDLGGMTGSSGNWCRYRCPAFGTDESMMPADVANLIRWCLAEHTRIPVDYLGKLEQPST